MKIINKKKVVTLIDIIIGFVMAIIGVLGILISKKPKNNGNPGDSAFIGLYYHYYVLIIFGTFLVISEIFE